MKTDLGNAGAQPAHGAIGPGSDKNFGLVFAGFFGIVAAVRAWHDLGWVVSAAVAILMLVLAYIAPAALAPFNRIWYRFGMLLSRIVNPLVLMLLFFVTVTPLGWLMRLTGKDPLRLKFQSDIDSYWIVRDPPGPPGTTLNQQF